MSAVSNGTIFDNLEWP